jgi:hypothetical protein
MVQAGLVFDDEDHDAPHDKGEVVYPVHVDNVPRGNRFFRKNCASPRPAIDGAHVSDQAATGFGDGAWGIV